jgi:hypothetical protein
VIARLRAWLHGLLVAPPGRHRSDGFDFFAESHERLAEAPPWDTAPQPPAPLQSPSMLPITRPGQVVRVLLHPDPKQEASSASPSQPAWPGLIFDIPEFFGTMSYVAEFLAVPLSGLDRMIAADRELTAAGRLA